MNQSVKHRAERHEEPVRVLGRGLRAARGVHLTLRTLRDAAGKTQLEVAKQSQIDQADISRLEARADFGDCQVATVRKYIEAVGGTLELVANFGEKRIIVVGIEAQPATKRATKALQRPVRRVRT